VKTHRLVAAGDATLVVEFEERVAVEISARTTAVADAIEAEKMPGVRDVVPTYRSIAVYFDPLATNEPALRLAIDAAIERVGSTRPADRAVIEIPVCYGGEFGPDLGSVAAFGGVSQAEAIALHASVTYHVMMLGFMPGFAYMSAVDSRIAAPRLESPRPHVPRGSVAVAKEQTGIYPGGTPGGWQVIGRSPVRPFDMARPTPFLFRAGDAVRFVPIDAEEFERLDRAS
jgi:inhibitor of KinA